MTTNTQADVQTPHIGEPVIFHQGGARRSQLPGYVSKAYPGGVIDLVLFPYGLNGVATVHDAVRHVDCEFNQANPSRVRETGGWSFVGEYDPEGRPSTPPPMRVSPQLPAGSMTTANHDLDERIVQLEAERDAAIERLTKERDVALSERNDAEKTLEATREELKLAKKQGADLKKQLADAAAAPSDDAGGGEGTKATSTKKASK